MAGCLAGPKTNGGEPEAWWLVNEAGLSNPTDDAEVKVTAGSERNHKFPEELQTIRLQLNTRFHTHLQGPQPTPSRRVCV